MMEGMKRSLTYLKLHFSPPLAPATPSPFGLFWVSSRAGRPLFGLPIRLFTPPRKACDKALTGPRTLSTLAGFTL